ncbi:MAG: viral suppressor of RNA silencing [Solanum nigrum ilarvirus 1]|uniref:Viral suppressor of RNA silencing n=1 Tax=Solanum nigrum ilarvirus 1 TaxID=2676886 RepID=A0AAX3BQF3_9BROM|nr:MAG: viral suppressor of RNA silencing [Solanum nigrum ilarvirus 1]UZZ63619.1 MAG: 2b protein [Grapevine associated ilarvirus]WFG33713.1 MAG: viral suppressor of RNA silencing [Solanum nigrum ilarvirus 1]DBA07054.1 TPA_asm: viral suppressor of RNA silencing [Solanum nigrum ilarvirus 1]DBA07059.1 TPA_asm: viral suppressor of RNA silencing [Solanum nigrum ilarvirus 1]
MFIPICLLLLVRSASADLMGSKVEPSDLPSPTIDGQTMRQKPEPRVEIGPGESINVKAGRDQVVQVPVETRLEERSPPGRAGSNCIDCAIAHLPETIFSVKVPKLNINFEVSDFPSSRLIFANLADRVRQLPFVKSLSVPTDTQRLQLKTLGDVEVHISIPKFGWNQILKLSDVVSGFNLPKIPSIAPKVESCVGECLTQ